MTDRGKQLAGAMARNLELIRELDRTSPADVEEILRALVSTLRTWKPDALKAGLDTSPMAKVDLGAL